MCHVHNTLEISNLLYMKIIENDKYSVWNGMTKRYDVTLHNYLAPQDVSKLVQNNR